MHQIHLSQLLPARIEAAIQFLNFIGQNTRVHNEAGSCYERDMTVQEQGTFNAAMTLLRNYFTGEIDLEPKVVPGIPPQNPPPNFNPTPSYWK